MKQIKVIVLVCFTLFFGKDLYSQGKDVIIAYGKFKIEWGNTDKAKILLYEDGALVEEYEPARNGKFEFPLILNHNYLFHFKKPGYVSKKIEFNTSVPEQVTSSPDFIPFPDFEFQVTLFKTYPDVDTVFFVNPVGKIKYDKDLNDFDYDKDYTLDMWKKMEEIEKDIRKKHDDHEKNNKEKTKQELDQSESLAQKEDVVQQDDSQSVMQEEPPANKPAKIKLEEPKQEKKEIIEQTEVKGNPEPKKSINTTQSSNTNSNYKEARPPKVEKTTPQQSGSQTNEEYVPKKRDENLPKTKNIQKQELTGRTITRVTVKQGDFTTTYIKVEHSWGGRYFFIQDEENRLRNISETIYNLKTSLK